MARGAPFLLAFLLLGCAACGPERDSRIVVGTKNFTEQIILGELLAQHIEARTGLAVERRFDLGGTLICHQALRAGAIDLYVEYTGTALTVILEAEPTQDPERVYRRVKGEYARRFNLEWAPPLGFNNTFALVVRGEDAQQLNLTKLSDIAPYTPKWRAGFGYEFMERPDGFQGLAETYGLRFGHPPRTMELGLLYRALKEKEVDIVAGASTDGLIAALNLVVLQDDRRYFPPYYAAPVVRREVFERHPRLRKALQELAGKINQGEMRQLNYAVEGEGGDVKQVVRAFLRAKGL